MAINWETKSSNVNNISKKGSINWGLSATKTNAGGLSGGLKYLGINLGAGAFGLLEGAYDFTVGGIADLFGADEYAKKLHANDISGQWQQKAAEKFNPSKGWEFAGQVASGVGQSAVGIGAAVLTGGSSLAAAASIGLGAAGKSTTSAYQQTGELGAKEYTYGAASGLLEAALESFTGAAGKIGKRIASPTAKAIAKSTVRQGIVKTMLSEGAGEFVEEALSEYIDPYLLRATKVDPNAENATLQEIAYAGLVGFFSGAILSGTTSTASNMSNVRRGNKVAADGKTNTLLAKATELKEYTDTAIAESADSNLVAQPLKQLTASVNAYDKLKNKDSLKGKMLLGEIQQGVAYVESAQGVQTSLANVKANAEALAQTEYFKNTYKDYTAADIKANKDGIATKLAISDFAGKMLIPTEQYTAQMQAGQMAQGETQYNTWRENIDDKTAESVSKQLGIDIKTASYYEATQAVENYNKSGKNIPTLPDKISLKVGDSTIYRTADGKMIGIKRGKKGYYVAINDADGQDIGKTSKAIPESEIYDFIATLTAPQAEQSEQKALSDTNAENTTEAETTIVEPQTEIVQPLKKAQTAAATVTARKYVKNFDLLDTATRGRIVEAIISGTQYEVNNTTLNAVANLLSVRKGLNISFSNIDANGLYTTVKGERFAVINPKLSDNMLRETILHELTHDLERTKGYTALQTTAIELADETDKKRITEQYTKYYEDNDLVKSASLIDEEITAHFFSQFMGQSDFISKYANEQLSTFQKAKKWISNLAERLKNINNQAYKAAKQLENLYEDVVTAKAESKDGEKIKDTVITAKQPIKGTDVRYALQSDKALTKEQANFLRKLGVIQYKKNNEVNSYNIYIEDYNGNLEYENPKATVQSIQKMFGKVLSDEILDNAYYGRSYIYKNQIKDVLRHLDAPSYNSTEIISNAKKYFGTTVNPHIAFYVNTDGTMLNGSVREQPNYRSADHREISDVIDDLTGGDAMLKYMEFGNIRLMPESPSFDFDNKAEPTEAQYATIEKILPRLLSKGSGFLIDFTDTQSGYATASIEYNENVRASKIVSDIRYYYKNGKIPVQSDIAKFRYSLPLKDNQGRTLTKEQLADPYTMTSEKTNVGTNLSVGQVMHHSESEARDEKGRLLEVYHGTNAEFTVFKRDYRGAIWTTDNKITAERFSYNASDSKKLIKLYANIKNPLYKEFSTITNWDIDDVVKEAVKNGRDGIIINFKIDEKRRFLEDMAEMFPNKLASEVLPSTPYQSTDQYVKANESISEFLQRAKKSLYKYIVAFSPSQIKLTTNLNPTENEDIRFSLTRDSVLTKMPTETTPTRKEKMWESWTGLQIAFVNEQAGVEKALKALGVKNGEALTNFVRSANKAGEEMLAGNQYSASGKYQGEGLSKIFAQILAKGAEYEQSFYDYLANYHHIDRLKQGKGILEVTEPQSRAIIAEYEKAYPEFKEIATKVWQYNKNLLQYQVDTKIITQKFADKLNEMYPHYVPAYRDVDGDKIRYLSQYRIKVKQTIKRATGGTDAILPIGVIMGRRTLDIIKAGRTNMLANALYKGSEKTSDYANVQILQKDSIDIVDAEDMDFEKFKPNNNQITFFNNGERVTMRVSKDIFAGFNAFSPAPKVDNIVFKGLRKVNATFKRLVTSLNPAFLVRNSVRDLQDAGLYTKYGTAFMSNYKEAINQIKTDGEYWKLYRAMGGFTSSVFDFEKGFVAAQNRFGLTKAEGNILSKGLTALENANAFIEQLPRLAEFMSSLQAGNSVEQALLDSADVTVNFGRTGAITKKFNSTLMPFLNPAIQGFDKIIRTLTGARTKKAITSLIVKAAVVGILPQLLNQLMYDDDEDYALLRDTDKENNYLFKIGDKFIKIPKGRVVSVFSGLVSRTAQMAKGEKDVWEGYGKNVLSQITPVDNLSRTILSPFSDIKNNLTWYGTAIEGRQFENVEPKKRFDEGTSSIAIALGKVLNYSPKKIHYLIDQYSGVIGDFILPATTARAERDFLSGNFTIDPVNSNRLSTKFYKLYDETNYAKTAGNETAAYQLRYLNKVKSAVSQLYNEKSAIQASDLSDKEKIAETKTIQALINEAYKTALADNELMTNAIKATEGIADNLRYTEATRLMYGAERALREYDSSVYAKAQSMSVAGIDYDTYYSYYFGIKTLSSETDANGNAITGSKKTNVLKYIASLKIPTVQKYLLVLNSGYVISDGDIKNVSKKQAYTAVAEYISKLKLSATSKIELAEQLGLTVKNNKIIV